MKLEQTKNRVRKMKEGVERGYGERIGEAAGAKRQSLRFQFAVA